LLGFIERLLRMTYVCGDLQLSGCALCVCRSYSKPYFYGFFPLFLMIVPPGILLNLAFPVALASAENW
jgi:hypothetical protein